MKKLVSMILSLVFLFTLAVAITAEAPPQSGEYRCSVTAYVKDADGRYLETVPASSGSEYYSFS